MKCVMIRYKVKKDKVEMVKKGIVEFLSAVKRNEPYTLYDSYQEDETAFVHILNFRDAKSEELHAQADYTNKFVDLLYLNCEKEPVFTELKLVRSTRPEHGAKW